MDSVNFGGLIMVMRILFIGISILISGESLALTAFENHMIYQPQSGSTKVLDLRTSTTQLRNNFGLTGELTGKGIHRLLQSYGLDNFIGIKEVPGGDLGFGLVQDTERSKSIEFHLGGFPFCQGGVRIHRLANHTFITGTMPKVNPESVPTAEDFPHLPDLAGTILEALRQEGLAEEVRSTINAKRCIWVEADGTPRPSWDVTVNTESDLPYRLIADQTMVYQIAPMFFSAIGKTKSYDKNPTNGALSFSAIGDLTGTGRMATPYFEVDTNDIANAKECDHNFLYEPTDERFAEASVFTHSTKTFDWYRSTLAFEWKGNPMRLIINADVGSTPNNALYKPAAANEQKIPTIAVGDGDGSILQNLLTDGDVVSHEFGHHVVYRVVTATSGESQIIHEAMADFFTFARTGDSCLGESICPVGSRACYVPATCLRTADNTLSFADAAVQALPKHQQGQVFSGLLWDLTAKYQIPRESVISWTYGAVNLLNTATSIDEFVAALYSAEQTLFSGQYCSILTEAVTERGLDDKIPANTNCSGTTSLALSQVGVDEEVPVTEGLILAQGSNEIELANIETTVIDCNAIAGGTKPAQKKSKRSDLFDCGTVQSKNLDPSAWFNIWLLFGLPILVVFSTSRRRKRT